MRDPFKDLANEVVRESFVDPLMAMAPMIARALRRVAEEARERAEARIYERERRRAVQWLHERADSMNDEKARAVLHSAATNLGWHNARGEVPAAPASPEALPVAQGPASAHPLSTGQTEEPRS